MFLLFLFIGDYDEDEDDDFVERIRSFLIEDLEDEIVVVVVVVVEIEELTVFFVYILGD